MDKNPASECRIMSLNRPLARAFIGVNIEGKSHELIDAYVININLDHLA